MVAREPVLTENALFVLRNRYLAKNERGEIVERAEELLRRVARNLTLIDILYDDEVYDPDVPDNDGAYDPAVYHKIAASRKSALSDVRGKKEEGPYTCLDISTLVWAYESLRERGHMKVGLDRLLEIIGKRRSVLEEAEKRLYAAMASLKLLFNSPTLMNAGRELQQLSACFVLPIEDSLGGIFDTVKHTALIHQSGGGTGFSFSRLRPKDDIVKSTGGGASGPVSFMKVFDSSTNAVKQGGTRRGANMGILRCDHPDIMEFINSKTDNEAIPNFNISVALTNSFMEAVESDGQYGLENPRTGETTSALKAREVFYLISERAWANGEPGVIFIDRLNKDNPTPKVGAIESTNPCGEQPLLPYESCNLASLNLARMVSGGKLDYESLGDLVDLAVHYLDNVIDANRYPMPEIEWMTKRNRKIGLGVMGWADGLIQLGIPYGSEEAIALAEEVMGFIDARSKKASAVLAERRGAFRNFPGSAPHLAGRPPLRNATTTTIAPTGTISIIADASSGIEPLFSIAFTRRGILGGQELVEINPLFEGVARRQGFHSDSLMARVAQVGSIQTLDEVPPEIKNLFVTALDIDPEWHIRMQAAFQRHTDNAVSKTVNLPFEATPEDIRVIYRRAYELGCKGVTVYRNGSRAAQVLNVGQAETSENGVGCGPGTGAPGAATAPGAPVAEPRVGATPRQVVDRGPWGKVRPIPRPAGLSGVTVRKITPLGNLYLTLNTADEEPFELFAQIGKAGSDVSAFTEGLARLISLALRCGIDPQVIAEELIGIGGNRSVGFGPNRVKSVPDAIARFLDEYLSGEVDVSPWAARRAGQLAMFDNGPGNSQESPRGREVGVTGPYPNPLRADDDPEDVQPTPPRSSYDLCPACGMQSLAYEEGCLKCRSCGYSEC